MPHSAARELHVSPVLAVTYQRQAAMSLASARTSEERPKARMARDRKEEGIIAAVLTWELQLHVKEAQLN